MSYNGSGTFQINTSGQPVVAGTVISSTAFNALTADLATGLSTAITKDGQTTTSVRIPFAAGINSSLTTDSTSTSTGSIITAGGVGVAKALYVGTTLSVTGNAGIGTTSPNSKMSVAVSSTSTSVLGSYTNIPLLLQNTSSTDNNWSVIAVQDASGDFSSYIGTQNTSQASNTAIMAFATNGGSGATERMRIDSNGNVGIGTATPTVPLQIYSATNAAINVQGDAGASLTIQRYSTNATQPSLNLFKARGTLASPTAVATGDQMGQIAFQAYGGTTTRTIGAIRGYVETYTSDTDISSYLWFGTTPAGTTTIAERMRIDSAGNAQLSTGAVMPYAPAPTGIAAATTLTNANIQGQIISATGTTYTITMPLGTTMETLATWATTNIAYDFFVINTASGVITMAVNTGVTSLGSLTIAIGASAHFRIRRTAANTFVLYRLV
jgi:hypothetical protein